MDVLGKFNVILNNVMGDAVVIGLYMLLSVGMLNVGGMIPTFPYKGEAMYAVQRVTENVLYHFFGSSQIKTLLG
jgi:hypothetical protein